jgi:uncharacterized protein (TIGR03437 family)
MTTLQLERRGVTGPRTAISVTSTSPGLYTLDGTGRGNVLAILANGSINERNNPAIRGTEVAIYATGLGQTDPALTDGIVVEGPRRSTQMVSVMVGNTPAEIIYAGAAPGGIAGVYQVNFIVPAAAATSSSVPISVRAGNNASPGGTTISVQ